MSRSTLQADSQFRELARRISQLGLRPLALFALEAGRPLALLSAQFVWIAQPLLCVVYKPQQLASWAQFLEEPGSIDAFIGYIEAEE